MEGYFLTHKWVRSGSKQRSDGFHQCGIRSKVGSQGMPVFTGDVLAGIKIGKDIGPAKTVNSLFRVTNQEQWEILSGSHSLEYVPLERIRILKFIDHGCHVALPQFLSKSSSGFGFKGIIKIQQQVIEGALIPGKRVVEGPFGEAPGYLGPQRFIRCVEYEVRAINYRKGAMYQSVITPEGDKPWMDLPREGAYLRRCREAVPGVKAVCKLGRQANYNIFISMKKMSEGDPGRAAAAALTFDHAKNVFVFDDDIDVYDPTDVLWAVATRVQPHKHVSIMPPLFRGNMLDPSLDDEIKTSCMIIDATRPLDRPFSPVSKCPDEAMARIRLEDYVPGEILQHIPIDRTTYWA